MGVEGDIRAIGLPMLAYGAVIALSQYAQMLGERGKP